MKTNNVWGDIHYMRLDYEDFNFDDAIEKMKILKVTNAIHSGAVKKEDVLLRIGQKFNQKEVEEFESKRQESFHLVHLVATWTG
eukprot:768643-Hanusia_phi.AAC.2